MATAQEILAKIVVLQKQLERVSTLQTRITDLQSKRQQYIDTLAFTQQQLVDMQASLATTRTELKAML